MSGEIADLTGLQERSKRGVGRGRAREPHLLMSLLGSIAIEGWIPCNGQVLEHSRHVLFADLTETKVIAAQSSNVLEP